LANIRKKSETAEVFSQKKHSTHAKPPLQWGHSTTGRQSKSLSSHTGTTASRGVADTASRAFPFHYQTIMQTKKSNRTRPAHFSQGAGNNPLPCAL
jgi:hypothetical protein